VKIFLEFSIKSLFFIWDEENEVVVIISLISSFLKFPFGIIIQQLPFSKKVRYYEREMKLIFDKWNLEKIKKIIN